MIADRYITVTGYDRRYGVVRTSASKGRKAVLEKASQQETVGGTALIENVHITELPLALNSGRLRLLKCESALAYVVSS
jgi:hypothetical protein